MEKLVYGGAGLSRVEGRVVLTPFVLPGEQARVAIRKTRNGVAGGELLTVLEPSPQRAKPGCPFFLSCGGCQYQHAEYRYQLEQKRVILREVLERIGKLAPPEDIGIVSGPEWNYRNRSQLHLASGQIGYLRAQSHQLVGITHSPISSPKLNEALAALREMLRKPRFPRFIHSLELFTNETDVQLNVLEKDQGVARSFFEWCAGAIPGYVSGALHYGAFRVSYGSFFQVNRFLVDKLVETALDEAGSGETALDLYAGVGLFSVPLAGRFAKVTAVESGISAGHDLQANAGASVEAVREPVEQYLAAVTATPDFVLADPPRAGLDKTVVEHLLRLKPKRLTIVACDPSTLARDLAALIKGGYHLRKMTLVDLFPQTYHIETIAHLQL
ncbi:MAG: class I SAM-dependent RNA methyltransferase [Acidobacteria bacterium]|nr:class I SAM-dependent RNA methyltransferase [Acidobacteriota bacterium]